MFKSEEKLELDCTPAEGATTAAADYSGSPISTRTSSVDGTTDGASVVSLAALSSDDTIGSTVEADSARIGSGTDADEASDSSVGVEATTGAGAARTCTEV